MKSKLGSKLASTMARTTGSAGLVPHLIVEARAGTGKTTTLVEALKELRDQASALTPSPQQRAVWDAVKLSAGVRSVGFVAFNRSIAAELKTRVPADVDAMTMHSMGMKAVNRAFPKLRVNEYRVSDLIGKELNRDVRELRKKDPVLLSATEKLVGLCKMNLVLVPDRSLETRMTMSEQLDVLCDHYQVETDKYRTQVYDLVPKVLDRCKDPVADGCMDFDDMVWLPVALDLPVWQYDVLCVDECQDLSRVQQGLAKKAGKRLILVGDPRQAIYGFAGADSESMGRMYNELKASPAGCDVLPLTVTRRCGKAIVEEARKYVPDFTAHESNPEGAVTEAKYPTQPGPNGAVAELPMEQTYLVHVEAGDRVVCRTNAPLVRQCFKFLRMGRKAVILGRDVGQGLISLVKKSKAGTSAELIAWLADWLEVEREKENAKKNPSEAKVQGLEDRADCLMLFANECKTADEVVRKVESIFTENKNDPGVLLSSVHKAKGLEARRVFFLVPAVLVQGFGRKDQPKWVTDQETNLKYVAVTRAIEELVFVR